MEYSDPSLLLASVKHLFDQCAPTNDDQDRQVVAFALELAAFRIALRDTPDSPEVRDRLLREGQDLRKRLIAALREMPPSENRLNFRQCTGMIGREVTMYGMFTLPFGQTRFYLPHGTVIFIKNATTRHVHLELPGGIVLHLSKHEFPLGGLPVRETVSAEYM